MDERVSGEGPELTPDVEDAFALLADDTRLAIMRELYAREEPLRFSELRDRVGVRDSGQFNYHLGKLTGQFVEQTDEGYELTMAGLRVLGAVFAGSYGEQTIDPVPIDDPCPLCAGELAATYDRDHFEIACQDCEAQIVSYPAPPGILRGRDRAALLKVFSRYAHHVLGQITDGFCPFCLGEVAAEIGDESETGIETAFRCRNCGVEMTMTAAVPLLVDPDVAEFARDHGIDLQRTPIWNLDPFFGSEQRLLTNEPGPEAVEIVVTIDEETLTARLDDRLRIVGITRS